MSENQTVAVESGPSRIRRNRNKKFAMVMGVTAVLHVVALIALGSFVIFTAIRAPEPEFEAPAQLEPIQPEQLQMQQNMANLRESSPRPQPQQRITVQIPQNIQMANVELNIAPPVTAVNVSAAGSGRGLGGIGGSGGIGFGRQAFNFLGVQASGERVAIVIDASDHMLLDEKGGLHAFRIVKEESKRLISEIPPTSVFNVYLFGGSRVNQFKPHMVAPTPGIQEEFAKWIDPINEDASARGPRANSFEPDEDIFRGRSYANFPRALHAAMEDQADAIFMIVATWSSVRKTSNFLSEGQLARRSRDRERGQARVERNYERAVDRWTEEDQARWDAYQRDHVQPMRQRAREIWDAENARRAARGQPPRVVLGNAIDTVIREQNLRDQLPPAPPRPPRRGRAVASLGNLSVDEIIQTFRRDIFHEYYRDLGRQNPTVSIILFGQNERAEENFTRLARTSNRGQFRVIDSLAEMQAARDESRQSRR